VTEPQAWWLIAEVGVIAVAYLLNLVRGRG